MALSQPQQIEPTINWSDGIAFMVGVMPPNDEVIKENLAGKIHYGSVRFTRTDFNPQVTVRIGPQEYRVRLRKADDNPTFVELAKFLNNFK